MTQPWFWVKPKMSDLERRVPSGQGLSLNITPPPSCFAVVFSERWADSWHAIHAVKLAWILGCTTMKCGKSSRGWIRTVSWKFHFPILFLKELKLSFSCLLTLRCTLQTSAWGRKAESRILFIYLFIPKWNILYSVYVHFMTTCFVTCTTGVRTLKRRGTSHFSLRKNKKGKRGRGRGRDKETGRV